jgi:hypothetical protein
MKAYRKRIPTLALALAAIAGPVQLVSAQADATKVASTKPASFSPADDCTSDPKFLQKMGISRKAMVDTTQSQPVGMSVVETDEKGKMLRRGQHPSWAQAGYLGRVQRDRDGNIYSYAVPGFTLQFNPPEKANFLHRVDTETGVMAPFVEIKSDKGPTERNPFGVLALTLDCAQNALYVATVMGSSASEEHGVIARVGLADRSVRIVKRGVDALSLTIGQSAGSRRLFLGTARDNSVISYGINAQGDLVGDAALEIDLDQIPAAQDKRATVMRFNSRGQLSVRAIPFDYTLAVRSTIPTTELTFASGINAAGATSFSLQAQRSYDHGMTTPRPDANSAPAKTP